MHVQDTSIPTRPKQKSFTDSQSWAERRRIARCIDRSSLSRSDQFVLKRITNLWFYHRFVAKVIYPGVERLAKLCRLSVRTVRYALKMFRDNGWIKPVAFAKGGAKSTRYTVDLDAITEALDPCRVRTAPGELVYVGPEDDPGIEYADDGLPLLAEPYDFAAVLAEKSRKIIGLLSGNVAVTFRDTPAKFAAGYIGTEPSGFFPTKEKTPDWVTCWRIPDESRGFDHA